MLKRANHLRRLETAEVYEIADFPGQRLCHVYMEAPVTSPDSSQVIVHSNSTPHGQHDLQGHFYYRCDLADGGSVHQMTWQPEATAPAISADGLYFYYILDFCPTRGYGHDAELRRCRLTGGEDTLVCRIPGICPDSGLRLGKFYSFPSVSSDGRRLAARAELQSPLTGCLTYALLIFDLQRGTVMTAWQNMEFPNLHPQYCRSLDPRLSHDLMIQHNHGHHHDNPAFQGHAAGKLISAAGADIHLLCDDGTHLRDLPFGRSPFEGELGHQCWVGRSEWVIGQCRLWREPFYIDYLPASTANPHDDDGVLLFAAKAVERQDHGGRHTPGASRLALCGQAPDRWFGHFATDIAGRRLIVDALNAQRQLSLIYLVNLGDLDRSETPQAADWQLLADSQTSNQSGTYGTEHCHPFLSPDGRYAFFNSNADGVIRPYVADLKPR